MKNIIEIFDDVLLYLLSYPVTLFNLLFFPRKVLGKKPTALKCPAGASFILSMTIAFFANRLLDRIFFGFPADLPMMPSEGMLVIFSIFTVVIIIIQWFLFRVVFRIQTSRDNLIDNIKALSYPITMALAIYALAVIFSINFPGVIRIIALKTPTGDQLAFRRYGYEFVWGARQFSTLLMILFYLWTLSNVIRVKFNISVFKSIWLSLCLSIASLMVFVVILGVFSQTE